MGNLQESTGKDTLRFVLLTAKSLLESGLPSHRLEEKLEKLCTQLAIEAEFFTTPGSIFASITIEGVMQSHMIKVTDSELHLEKMDAIENIIEQVNASTLSIPEAIQQLKVRNAQRERYPTWMMILFFGISTAAAACVFGGQLPEIISAFIIGLGIGSFGVFLQKVPQLGKVFVLISAVWAVSVASFFQAHFVGFQADIATICGLILLIPGFTFTVSITEMVNNHLIAGLSRFTTAFVTFIMLAIGIAIGKQLMFPISHQVPSIVWSNLPFWKEWIALVFVPLGFVVLFKAKPRDFLWILVGCWTSYFSFKISNWYTSPTTAVFIASFLLGVVSNLFAGLNNRNASVMLVPGMILLVPGSLGFFSISHLVESDIVAGLQIALKMLSTSMALVLGILFSNLVPFSFVRKKK
jgi:uncharacterized membrane protein YjjP (DUF1212 family)